MVQDTVAYYLEDFGLFGQSMYFWCDDLDVDADNNNDGDLNGRRYKWVVAT